MDRQPIPKGIRFEVFKRDSFKCQYCGASAPDVLLHIDHIKPAAKGGTNDITNLVTACEGCNLGKSDKLLSDNAAVNKSRNQLEVLQERRDQLEMMMEWQEGLQSLKETVIQKVISKWESVAPGFSVNENGQKRIKKIVRNYPIDEIFEAIGIAAEQYLEYEDDGSVTDESWEKGFKKIEGICRVRKNQEEKPYLKDLYYARGILRNRVYVDEKYVMEMMENAVMAGAETQWIIQEARNCRNWTQFREEMHDFIERNA
ncbi:HNH endonuclease [Gynuella sp.]|uniref:HNH endonuclease n=1 Tax=Gynuella sp. TaxID=2969146 RepID=UPI003D09E2C1